MDRANQMFERSATRKQVYLPSANQVHPFTACAGHTCELTQKSLNLTGPAKQMTHHIAFAVVTDYHLYRWRATTQLSQSTSISAS